MTGVLDSNADFAGGRRREMEGLRCSEPQIEGLGINIGEPSIAIIATPVPEGA
jgi:hypothetical protein